LLAVGDNINAIIDLVADNLRYCALDPSGVGVVIVDFAMVDAPYELESKVDDYFP
jgi:hypothetical protein